MKNFDFLNDRPDPWERRLFARHYYRFLIFTFPVLRSVIPSFRKFPCYWYARFQFRSLRPEDRRRCRMNILLDVHVGKGAWGHCWLTLDGSSLHYRRATLGTRIQCIGTSGFLDYWLPV
jgi:hypothetical protein